MQAPANPDRNAYFGDLHVHTRLSFDAFLFGTHATPGDAYRYALGEPIEHAAGFTVQLDRPLDFYAVTDHSEFLGNMLALTQPDEPLYNHPAAKAFREAKTVEERRQAFASIAAYLEPGKAGDLLDLNVVRSAWQTEIEAAEQYNRPGSFTTFIGYEYTSGPEQQNLHRNIIFRGNAVPDLPYTRLDSMNPEDLWDWLDAQRAEGHEALSIPHNSNGSNGQMFALSQYGGEPLNADYAAQRMRNEPLVEITQVKGTSDTHPILSPNDEWANFEIMELRIASDLASKPEGSYVREALRHGIELADAEGFNPFQFGVIGSSDTHNAAGSFDEGHFFSKVGNLDATAELRGSVPNGAAADGTPTYSDAYYRFWGASGLAGVWAEENTRESLFDAMRRKETFATSGSRMKVRFFAGYDYPDGLVNDPGMIRNAYAGGVPMGADLAPDGERAPRFLVWALRDPSSQPLQRLQVIKGWMEEGTSREAVYDVACGNGTAPDADTHRCADNGASVNLADCSTSPGVAADELLTLWQDPDFTAGQRAFYYVRVLENPSCRWSTWDAVRAGVAPRPDLETTIQERAWSSPIWYGSAG
ncbi:MAG: DUF3604 domain-containing protein [Pseudomonadales bacterium]